LQFVNTEDSQLPCPADLRLEVCTRNGLRIFLRNLLWENVFFFWGDERHVPPEDPESNYRMANESLLSKLPIPADHVFRIQSERPDAGVGAQAYEQTLRDFFRPAPGSFPRFDLVLFISGHYRTRREATLPGGKLGGEVQHVPHYTHFSCAESRRVCDIFGQWERQG